MTEVAEAPAAQQESAGTLLRRAREASGLHVAALAVALKVPVRKLEALEEDRYEDMGDAVFIRALASSVCRTLKIDAQPVLERLPQSAAPRLVRDTDGINAPFRAPTDGPTPSWADAVRQPVPMAVIALLVGAVIIFFLPARKHEEPAAPAAVPATATDTVVTPVVPATAASEPAPAVPVAAPVAVAVPAAPQASAVKAAASGAKPAASAPAAAASAPVAQAPAVPASGIVVIRAKGESWVEVVDAKGAVPVRKLLAAGEAAGASGVLPLQVTIGKVDQVDVDVRGRKFDMRPVSKDNVARFTVK